MTDEPRMSRVDPLEVSLARRLPGADLARIDLVAALTRRVGHLVFRDVHYSREEARHLRSALARIGWLEPREREAIVEHVERDLSRFVPATWDLDVRTLHASLFPAERAQVYDALVELAAASRELGSLVTLTNSFGGGVMPRDRAGELGLDAGDAPVVAGLAPDAVRFDEEGLRLGAGMHEVVVPWPVLERLEARDPWPSLLLRWREGGYPGDATFRGTGPLDRLADRLQELFDFAAERLGRRAQSVVERGWLDMADVTWEAVTSFPEEPRPGSAGAYRTAAARRPDEPIEARRARATPLERLLGWLASTPETPWREHAEEIVVTDRHLYARRRDGQVARLPLWSLRTRLGGRDGVYVFGRRTRLVLPQREAPCPVAQHLDALLRSR